ncbi:Fur family transcriptional regulator [Halanaerobium sp.]|uniref:Fur family transcriptional regulator n=1 Tax=Halanaerobium sp. TaxID=1895664 RepID=UPI000DE7202A|nr:Fur family transcriptional regulator [Halanaerobium sp.]PUU95018.1 MAG: Fur family transcriptional regulator, ferric uptake regulator [Halanaerobium sp.]
MNIYMEDFKKKLNKGGYKITNQRKVIFEILLKNSGKHLNPEQIYELVREVDSDIGIATVYRTTKLFEEVGILSKVLFNDGCARYEIVLTEDESHSHHHLLCNNCGKIIEVKMDLLNELEELIEKEYNFEIHNHSLKFYGLCKGCKEEETNGS